MLGLRVLRFEGYEGSDVFLVLRVLEGTRLMEVVSLVWVSLFFLFLVFLIHLR
jgi:hypothetical protein